MCNVNSFLKYQFYISYTQFSLKQNFNLQFSCSVNFTETCIFPDQPQISIHILLTEKEIINMRFRKRNAEPLSERLLPAVTQQKEPSGRSWEERTHLMVIVTRNSQFAGLQVKRLLKSGHDTALARPGVVGIIILSPEGRCVFLPVGGTIYTTAVVLSANERDKCSPMDLARIINVAAEILQGKK